MSELTHAGVKGMKWGVRKKSEPSMSRREARKTKNENYSDRTRKIDQAIVGSVGVKSVNYKMNRGKTHKQAVRSVIGQQLTIGALAGAAYAANSSLGRSTIKQALSSLSGSRAGVSVNNMRTNTKSITKGYDLIQAGMKDGRWRI